MKIRIPKLDVTVRTLLYTLKGIIGFFDICSFVDLVPETVEGRTHTVDDVGR